MLSKQCPQCAIILPIREKICPECGQKVPTWRAVRNFVETSRLGLALLCIVLILFVGLGWFVRAQTGSRIPLFVVFLLVAPLVPWILKVAYGFAADDDKNNDEK